MLNCVSKYLCARREQVEQFMVAREAEKESVFYENQEAFGAAPQPAWAASAAGTVHLGAQSWDFGVNISRAAPPTPGYRTHSLLAACLLPACCLLTATASDRAASYLAYRLSPCVVCTGGARLAFSLGCRLPLHPDGLPAASFRGRRGRRATRLDTGGAGSTQPHHSRARESSRATSAAHRSGPG